MREKTRLQKAAPAPLESHLRSKNGDAEGAPRTDPDLHGLRVDTSRLAFDGTGRVKRGRESERTADNYSICEFSTGKIYNCDLNASYNIGARYFIRELTKSLPETSKQRLEAKVPSAVKRSTCTLSTLINLSAALTAAAV